MRSITGRNALTGLVAAFVLAAGGAAHAQATTAAATTDGAAEPAPKFDSAYLGDAANIKSGEDVWQQQCRHCHGNAAYPGKAPKLNPGAMDAEFIYDRVTYGFRKMPAWKEVFSFEQRKAVAAYVKSDRFSP